MAKLDKKERNKILGAIGFILLAIFSGVGFIYLQITTNPGITQ